MTEVGAAPRTQVKQGPTLAEQIATSQGEHHVVQAKLTTDERVLARVTDGIYREPSSAIRELISNAYDADATEVVIQTDRPRFSTITISDNGNGMSPEVVAHLIEHIGGSAKRSPDGIDLGVTKADDRFRSPSGRRLIGRIGIGLFSVSQLTHSFQIITKTKGDSWRTVAMVRLRTYDDETNDNAENAEYEAGLVSIWRVPASDSAASGTTIVLTGLQRHTVRTLSDADRWYRVQTTDEAPPAFHVGRTKDGELVQHNGGADDSVPWKSGDDGLTAFKALVDAVWHELTSGSTRNPSIAYLFDKYFQTVWEIALAVPITYVGKHPLLANKDDVERYVLGSDKRMPATLIEEDSLANALDVPEDLGVGSQPFRVFFDNLELRRPIRVEGLPATTHALKKPLMFAEHVRENFQGIETARSGGPLEFVAYILWAPKIAPIEHNGVLIRVHGSSGTLFDRTFLQYGVAETTRLRQLTCEIYVTHGFEAALNIDREGFNQAHPHARRLTAWLHGAIGRSINTQKSLANQVRRSARSATTSDQRDELDRVVLSAWQNRQREAGQPPPVRWSTSSRSATSEPVDTIRLEPSVVLGDRRDSATLARDQQQLAAIAQILAAYDLLESLSTDEINKLMGAIARALQVGA